MKEDEHKRIWMPVTGCSGCAPCSYCTELTPAHFFKLADLGNGLGIMRRWVFCDEECVNKFKKEIETL
jgi:hypothetical protein